MAKRGGQTRQVASTPRLTEAEVRDRMAAVFRPHAVKDATGKVLARFRTSREAQNFLCRAINRQFEGAVRDIGRDLIRAGGAS